MSISAGTRLGGKYELIRQLGEGGMGVVWLAKHCELGTEVAVKVLRSTVLNDKEAVTRFDREARAAASLRGPHITRTLDVGHHEDGSPFMVMEYLEGCDLGQEITAHGALSIAEAVHIVLQACEGMSEAHARGIVHRDLKPENLFLVRGPSGRRDVKILDFGISKFHIEGDLRVTQTQTSFGTPLYMSPEQVRSTKNVDHRTDLWSLGVILYEALTGEPPFMGDTPTAVAVAVTVDDYMPLLTKRPDAPPELEEVLARALTKDPAKRYQTADELADAIEPFCDAVPSAIQSRRVPAPPHVAQTNTMRVSSIDVPVNGAGKRGSGWIVAGVAIAAGVSVVVAVVVTHGRHAADVPAASKSPIATVAQTEPAQATVTTAATPAPEIAVGSSMPTPAPTATASAAASASSKADSAKPTHPQTSKTHEPVAPDPPVDKTAKPKPPDRNPQFL